MHGNTFEWCRDWYHATLPGGDDPDLYSRRRGTGTAPSRVRRGGAWTDDGLALPVRVPAAVRARASIRPHRVQGRGGQAVAREKDFVTFREWLAMTTRFK